MSLGKPGMFPKRGDKLDNVMKKVKIYRDINNNNNNTNNDNKNNIAGTENLIN